MQAFACNAVAGLVGNQRDTHQWQHMYSYSLFQQRLETEKELAGARLLMHIIDS